MYIIIEDNILKEWADYKFKPEAVEIDIEYSDYSENPSKYEVIDGVLTDISNTSTYTSQIQETQKEEIKRQIEQIEVKQQRALREMILSPNDIASAKLAEIEAQISALREQL